MVRNHILWKGLFCGIVVLLVGMSITSMVGSLSIEKEQSVIPKSCLDGINLTGTMGQNGWYVSAVTITFVGENATRVFIDGGDWFYYTGPFVVGTDGYHTLMWYYIDHWGGHSDYFSIDFKIDATLPLITLMKKITGINEVTFIANVCDATSGVWRVEFYLDDELNFTDYDFPFKWNWTGSGIHTVTAQVFDIAGNSASKSKITPYIQSQSQTSSSVQQNSQNPLQIYQYLIYNLILHHQIEVKLFQD